jgi:hypothetical protein
VGLGALLLLVLAGAAVLAMVLLRSALGVPSVRDLAALAPPSSRAFMAVSIRTGVEDLRQLQEWRTMLQESEGGRRALEEFEAAVGSSLEQVAACVVPAGFMAVLPIRPELGSAPGVVWALRVREEQAAREAVERLAAKATGPRLEQVQVVGRPGWVSADANPPLSVVVHGGYLVAGFPQAEVEAVLTRLESGSPGLAADGEFVRALGQVGAAPELFAWVNIPGLRQDHSIADASMPPAAQLILQDFRALSFGAERRKGTWKSVAFLGLIPQPSSGVGRALLQKPAAGNLDPAALVPADLGFYYSVDAGWALGLFREALVAAGGNLDPLGELTRSSGVDFPALVTSLSGHVGMSVDVLGQLHRLGTAFRNHELGNLEEEEPSSLVVVGAREAATLEQAVATFAGGMQRAAGQGQFTACKSNLINIAMALEMASTDRRGRYPRKLAELTPDYLRTIPTCPASGRDTYSTGFWSSMNPDYYEVACTGSHPAVGVESGFPRYNSIQGLLEGTPGAVAGVSPGLTRTSVPYQGTDIHGFSELPVRWARIDQPAPALLLGFGPQAQGLVQRALDVRDTGKSVAARTSWSRDLQGAGSGIVATWYFDLGPLFASSTAMLKEVSGSDPEMAQVVAFLEHELVQGIVQTPAAFLVRVEEAGLKAEFHGAGPPLLLGAAVGTLVPNFIRAQAQGQFTACKSNLKNIATALEMYSTDARGRYPTSLSALTVDQRYLRTLPTCPAAGRDTYSATYRSRSSPDRYTVLCTGENHKSVGVGENYPQYNSVAGLIEKAW